MHKECEKCHCTGFKDYTGNVNTQTMAVGCSCPCHSKDTMGCCEDGNYGDGHICLKTEPQAVSISKDSTVGWEEDWKNNYFGTIPYASLEGFEFIQNTLSSQLEEVKKAFNRSHTHCWNQTQPSACGIPFRQHLQCCLCPLNNPHLTIER